MTESQGVRSMEVHIDSWDPINIDVLVVESKLLGFNLLLRMDFIESLGSVHITKMGEVRFVNTLICAAMTKSAQFYRAIRPIYQHLDSIMEVVRWTPTRICKKKNKTKKNG